MSLQAIIEHIQNSGAVQIAEIYQQADKDAELVITEAKKQAEVHYQAAYDLELRQEQSEQARILNNARFEALCCIGDARDQLVEKVLQQVQKELQSARASPKYQDVVKGILYELLPAGTEQREQVVNLILEADRRDQILVERLLRSRNLDIRVDYILNSWGGLNTRSRDGHTRLINTLEARYERALPYLRLQLMNCFSEGVTAQAEGQVQETVHVRV